MSGGPINGGVGSQVESLNSNVTSIIVRTLLRTTDDIINECSSMTCLYDRYWYKRSDIMSLPICLFYVKSIREIISVDTSEQRVLLYEPQLTKDARKMSNLKDQIRPGVQEVIVDNSVAKPKSYTMEILLPYQPAGVAFSRRANDMMQTIKAMADILSGGFTAGGSVPMNMIRTLQGITGVAERLASDPGAKFINKNSLEAMAIGQKVLTMKMWTGYEYKFVQIINLEISKNGLEDDMFRATLQLKERPVLTMTPASDADVPTNRALDVASELVLGVESTLSWALAEATGVRAASGKGIV